MRNSKLKLIIIFGPLAVGKMTVGQELEKITDLKLFHNHMSIDMVLPYFDMKSSSFRKLVNLFRISMFTEVVKGNLAGLIFTYVWELDSKKDCDFIDTIVNIFEKEDAKVCYVELKASVKERLKRNKSPNRLKYKPSKNDFEASEIELLETDKNHTLNSEENKFKSKDHLKINNTKINAVKVAALIKERFSL